MIKILDDSNVQVSILKKKRPSSQMPVASDNAEDGHHQQLIFATSSTVESLSVKNTDIAAKDEPQQEIMSER